MEDKETSTEKILLTRREEKKKYGQKELQTAQKRVPVRYGKDLYRYFILVFERKKMQVPQSLRFDGLEKSFLGRKRQFHDAVVWKSCQAETVRGKKSITLSTDQVRSKLFLGA